MQIGPEIVTRVLEAGIAPECTRMAGVQTDANGVLRSPSSMVPRGGRPKPPRERARCPVQSTPNSELQHEVTFQHLFPDQTRQSWSI